MVVQGARFCGAMTWKPRLRAEEPSAWMLTIKAAPCWPGKAPRLSTQGPHRWRLLALRVITTLAPILTNRARTARLTCQATVASGTPALVAVPVVLQAFLKPPASTSWLIWRGNRALPN